jgi:hypothetical protein
MTNKQMLIKLWRYYQRQKYNEGMTLAILSHQIGISTGALHDAIHPKKRIAGPKRLRKIQEFMESENLI